MKYKVRDTWFLGDHKNIVMNNSVEIMPEDEEQIKEFIEAPIINNEENHEPEEG